MAKAITVKVLPATETKPKRYKAYDSDGNFVITGAPMGDICPYGHAAKSLCDRMQWRGAWYGASASSVSMVFVRTDNRHPSFTGV